MKDIGLRVANHPLTLRALSWVFLVEIHGWAGVKGQGYGAGAELRRDGAKYLSQLVSNKS
jgi:hypothetical protein